ncbi:MAG: d(CMP) kinase [Paracoccaceae bacterium]|nr:d(CMP) kinase [Paracoccaceae bacterium]
MRFTVAIDGPAAAGKGTIARAVAERFDFHHLDTGLLYRVVARKLLDLGRLDDAESEAPVLAAGLSEADLALNGLRDDPVSEAAARIAVLPEVRDALIGFQRWFAGREGGAVLDGRDIGTVVCPDAEVKLFVTAAEDIRARRRFREMHGRGETLTPDEVLQTIRARDALDSGRGVAPLRQAVDAVLLDTSELTIESAAARAVAVVEKGLGRGR